MTAIHEQETDDELRRSPTPAGVYTPRQPPPPDLRPLTNADLDRQAVRNE